MDNYFTEHAQALLPHLQQVRLLALDVDGVLTQSEIHILQDSNNCMKSFNALDGVGIGLVQKHGVMVAFITASLSVPIIKTRADALGVKHYITGTEDKQGGLKELLGELGFDAQQAAYVGDDVIDIGAITYSHVGISVPNAHPIVRDSADYVTVNAGGKGAVREVCDLLLAAHGHFEAIYGRAPL